MKLLLAFLLFTIPVQAQPWREWIATAIHAGAAVADVETTQHCLAARTCYEGNPLMPSSRAGMYAVDFGLVAGSAIIAHRMHKEGKAGWWVVPVSGIAWHGIGIGVTLHR
jgi:hypothetical protein